MYGKDQPCGTAESTEASGTSLCPMARSIGCQAAELQGLGFDLPQHQAKGAVMTEVCECQCQPQAGQLGSDSRALPVMAGGSYQEVSLAVAWVHLALGFCARFRQTARSALGHAE